MRRFDCHDRVKQVKSRYETALQTVKILIELAAQQPEYLHKHNLTVGEMRKLALELQDVYFVYMFACFESELRHYWRASVRNSTPLTQQLLSSIARRRGVPQDTLDAVHEIREFRNYLIHEQHEVKRRLTIDEASKHMHTYLARLPDEW